MYVDMQNTVLLYRTNIKLLSTKMEFCVMKEHLNYILYTRNALCVQNSRTPTARILRTHNRCV
jgi:hypothetical protein